MNDAISWAAIGAAASAVTTALGAIFFVAKASFQVGRLSGLVENGMSDNIKHTRIDISKIFNWLQKLPCAEEMVKVAEVTRRVEKIEKDIA